MSEISSTDSNNVAQEKEMSSETNMSAEQVGMDGTEPNTTPSRPTYEVVFFVRYSICPRPLVDELYKYFGKYGDVHHVNCPENKNYAFIFMTKLATTVEHRRTRTTISQIIQDMTPENRFHITVASSNRIPPSDRSQHKSNRSIRYPSPRYRVHHSRNSESFHNAERSDVGSRYNHPKVYHPEMFTMIRRTENQGIRWPNKY